MRWGRIIVKQLKFIKVCITVINIFIICKVSFVKWIFQTLIPWSRKDKEIWTHSESRFPCCLPSALLGQAHFPQSHQPAHSFHVFKFLISPFTSWLWKSLIIPPPQPLLFLFLFLHHLYNNLYNTWLWDLPDPWKQDSHLPSPGTRCSHLEGTALSKMRRYKTQNGWRK